MAAAADLEEAAGQAYDNLYPKWQTNLLRSTLSAFQKLIDDDFKDAVPNDRPVGNWFILVVKLVSEMPLANVSLTQFDEAVNLVYRICWATKAAEDANLISATQATAVLNAYNGVF